MKKWVTISLVLVFLLVTWIVINRSKAEPAVVAWNADMKTMVGALAFSPDGTTLAVYSAGNGGTDIWNIDQKQVVKHLNESGVMTSGELIEFSPSGRHLVMCPAFTLNVVDISTWAVSQPNMGVGGCQNVHFTPDGKKAIVAKLQSSIYKDGDDLAIFDSDSWTTIDAIRTMTRRNSSEYGSQFEHMGCKNQLINPANQILIHPDRPNVYFGLSNVFSVSKDGRLIVFSGQVDDPCDHPDLAAHNLKYEIAILNLESRKFMRAFEGSANALDWNVDGTHFAAAMGRDINVFDASSGSIVATERGVGSHTLLKYTPDGKYLIEQVEGKVEIWDAAHNRLLQTLQTQAFALEVSANGKYLALGGGKPSTSDYSPLLSLVAHPDGGEGRVVIYKLN